MKKYILLLSIVISSLFISCVQQEEEKKEPITKAEFTSERIKVAKGTINIVGFSVEPKTRETDCEVEYILSDPESDIVTLSKESSSGLVLTANKRGSIVLIAKCEGHTSYLEVDVFSDLLSESPFIKIPDVAYEMRVGDKKTFQVELSGGEETDRALFEFKSSDESVATIQSADNACMISCLKEGFTKIEVSHPKSQYPSSVLVFVSKEKENPVYITCDSNAYLMSKTGGTQNIYVNLANVVNQNLSLFSYEVTEGKDNISIISNNNVLSVTPKQKGESIVKVSHPSSLNDLEIHFIIAEEKCPYYIDTEKTFFEMSLGETARTEILIGGDDNNEIKNPSYTFTVEDESICNVVLTQSSLLIKALKSGRTRITINSSYTEIPHELYVVVGGVKEELFYITTLQNVIRMEEGDSDVELDISLAGGNESDKNSFTWTVSDSSIISVSTSYGTVNYERAAVYSGSEKLNAKAFITAKGLGSADIVVKHPKAENELKIKVFVYAKGTLSGLPPVLSGPALIKVLNGTNENVNLNLISGISDDLTWSVKDSSVAGVNGNGLSGVVTGKSSGAITDLYVSKGSKKVFSSVVMSGTQNYLDSATCIYLEKSVVSLLNGSKGYYEISSSSEDIVEPYVAAVSNPEILSCNVIGNKLCVQALKKGECTVAVTNSECVNTANLIVSVYDETSITKPYYFSYEKFVSCVVNQNVNYSVELTGSPAAELNKITWSCDDEEICTLESSGNQIRIYGKKVGKTYIYAHSDKAESDAKIIVNIVATEADLSRPVLDVSKTNYMCSTGEDIFVSVDVSEPDKWKGRIAWECSDISIVKIDSNYDSAVLRCLSEGDVTVTVTCENALPVKIFISVRDDFDKTVPFISLIPCAEIDEGESLTINANITGLTEDEINSITWKCDDESIVNYKVSYNTVIIRGVKEGFTVISASLPSKAIKTQMSVVVYKAGSPHLPVMAVSKAFYNLEIGKNIDIKLTFGSIKPSDEVKASLVWESDSDCIELNYSNEMCSVNAVHEGVAKVTVSSPSFYNQVSFTVAVGQVSENAYSFNGDRIIRIVKGSDITYGFSIYDMFYTYLKSYSEVTVREEGNDGYITYELLDNSLVINGIEKGNCHLYINHPLLNEEVKLLVYIFENEDELNNSFIITPKKDHFLLRKGNEINLNLEWRGDFAKTSSIRWSLDNSSCVSYDISEDKLLVKVKGRKEGNVIFTARHPEAKEDAVFYVSVTNYSEDYNNVTIITPSVVIMEADRQEVISGEGENAVYADFTRKVSVITNLSESEITKLSWQASDPSILSLDANGKDCILTGKKEGITELTCRYDDYNYAVMVVKVCSTNLDMYESSLFNIDRRLRILSKGEIVSYRPYMAYEEFDLTKTVFENLNDNNVVKVSNDNGYMKVEAVSEGVAMVKVSNIESENSFIMTFMVGSEKVTVSHEDSNGYLTALSYVYGLNPAKPLESCVLSVIPIGIDQSKYKDIVWTVSDKKICTINGNAETCICYPGIEGVCEVTASSVWSSNSITFRIVNSEDEISLYPMIKTESTAIRMKAGESKELTFEVTNTINPDYSKMTYTSSNENVVSISPLANTLTVKGISTGQSIIKVSYPGMDDINVVISVEGIVDNIVYLSTSNSYTTVAVGSTIKVNAILHNFTELNMSNYIWTIKEGNDCASLIQNGDNALIKGIKEGTVTLTCNHSKALCPIVYTVMVVDQTDYQPVYMKTDTVVTMEEGSKQVLNVSLVGGKDGEEGYFTWSVPSDSRSLIKVTSSGNQALVQALSAGVARITVSHPSCVSLPSIDIVLVINEKVDSETLVITTDSTIIEGKLTDSYKTVDVKLNGGTAEQQLLFTWEVLSFDSVLKNSDGSSLPVVELVNQSGNQNIVRYKNEGTAVVRVKNSATSYYLDIKFIINEYAQITFDSSNVTLKQYESATVSVASPKNKTIVYNSSDESIAMCYGTNSVCVIDGIKEGYVVITARASDGSCEDKLSVRVNKNEDAVPLYITSSSNVITLNTTDSKGYQITGVLNGTYNGNKVDASESESLVWKTKSGTNDVIKFASVTPVSVTGKTVTIIPVSSGEETVLVSHSKTNKVKEIYVKVSQPDSSMRLSSEHGVFIKGDIGSVSASLSGVPSSEESNIVWKVSDSQAVSIVSNAENTDQCSGSVCKFRCNKIAENGVVITCSYKNITKIYTVFVKELPMLSLTTSSDFIRSHQTRYYNIVCTPEEYINELTYTCSSNQFIKQNTSTQFYTGLIKTEAERIEAKDNPPGDIRVPYFKVTGGVNQGNTAFTFECRSLTAVLNVETSNKVAINLLKYEEYDSRGVVVNTVTKPSIIEADASDKYVRVYYNIEPDIQIPQLCTSGDGINVNLYKPFREGSVTIISRKSSGETGRYFDIYPDAKGCNWGDVKLKGPEGGEVGLLKISFHKDDSASRFNVNCTNNQPQTFKYDIINGFITGSGTTYNEGKPIITLTYSYPYCYCTKDVNSDLASYFPSGSNLISNAPSFKATQNNHINGAVQYVNYMGSEDVNIVWPAGYGLTGTYNKNFIFYEEVRN